MYGSSEWCKHGIVPLAREQVKYPAFTQRAAIGVGSSITAAVCHWCMHARFLVSPRCPAEMNTDLYTPVVSLVSSTGSSARLSQQFSVALKKCRHLLMDYLRAPVGPISQNRAMVTCGRQGGAPHTRGGSSVRIHAPSLVCGGIFRDGPGRNSKNLEK
jgi:hypothetical protein